MPIHTSRLAARAVAIAAAGVVAGLLGSGIAAAGVPVNNYLNWNGNFPIIGNHDPITTHTTTNLPSPDKVNTKSASFPVTVVVTAPALATTGLEEIGAATVQGSAKVTVALTDSAGTTQSQTITLTIPSTKTPPDGSPLTFTATGSTTIPAVAHTGNATIKVTAASTTLDPKDAGGNDTILGTFTVTLALDKTGPSQNPTNNTTLGTISVTS